MKNKNILIIIGIILLALYVFFVLVPDETDMETNKKEVVLYFTTDNAMYLKGEKRLIDTDSLYENTVKELIKGPESASLGRTFPEEAKLIDLEVKNNTVFINFNKALKEKHWGGSTGERMTVYSLVNTMTGFTDIDKVQLLIESEKIETLAGHMDLSIPLSANKSLIKN